MRVVFVLQLVGLAAGGTLPAVVPSALANKKRVLMLISDTGGGHRASAQALHDSCVSIYGELHSVP